MRCVRCGLPMSTCCPAVVLPSAAESAPASALRLLSLSASSQAKGRSSAEMPMDLIAAALTGATAEPNGLLDDGNSGLRSYATLALLACGCRPVGVRLLLLTLTLLLNMLSAAVLRWDPAACRYLDNLVKLIMPVDYRAGGRVNCRAEANTASSAAIQLQKGARLSGGKYGGAKDGWCTAVAHQGPQAARSNSTAAARTAASMEMPSHLLKPTIGAKEVCCSSTRCALYSSRPMKLAYVVAHAMKEGKDLKSFLVHCTGQCWRVLARPQQ